MWTRRQFLNQTGNGFGALALAGLLNGEQLLGASASHSSGTVKVLHNPPKAKRVVQLFMGGAASHLDLFDYKPALEKHHGEDSDFGEHVEAFQNGLGPWMKSPFKFQPYGKCDKPLSEVVAPLGDVVDDLAFIHNLVGKTGVHSQATYLQSTGFDTPGFPGMSGGASAKAGPASAIVNTTTQPDILLRALSLLVSFGFISLCLVGSYDVLRARSDLSNIYRDKIVVGNRHTDDHERWLS